MPLLFWFCAGPGPGSGGILLSNYVIFRRGFVYGNKGILKVYMQEVTYTKKKPKSKEPGRGKKGKLSVLPKGDILITKGQSSPRDPPMGKSPQSRAVQASSLKSMGFSKQCLLSSTHTPGAEFQVLHWDNTSGIPAVSLHNPRGLRQLSVAN